MRKFLLVAALLFSGCAALGIAPWQMELARNNANIAKLEIGISADSTYAIMGKPRLREAYSEKDGGVLDVWFYYTNRVWADGSNTKDEMTPVLFRNKQLIGYGQDYYTQNIKLIHE